MHIVDEKRRPAYLIALLANEGGACLKQGGYRIITRKASRVASRFPMSHTVFYSRPFYFFRILFFFKIDRSSKFIRNLFECQFSLQNDFFRFLFLIVLSLSILTLKIKDIIGQRLSFIALLTL